MLDLLQMWALVEVLGLVCLPLTITVCHNLPDRGWAFSKALAVMVFTFCIWLPLVLWHTLPYSQSFLIGIAAFLLICSLLGLWRTYRTLGKLVKRNLGYIIVTELIFLGMVFLLGWLRSYRPDIRSFEMFMDEGFIASIMRSPHMPPNDMWFANYSLNYYYYAHFTLATLAKFLGQAPSIAFNTGICICFGLTATNLFGVTSNVVAWARHLRKPASKSSVGPLPLPEPQEVLEPQALSEDPEPLEWPEHAFPNLFGAIPYGIATMLIGLVLGNLAATQEWWQQHGNLAVGQFDWFYAPTRVIDRTINEFPAFSFLLSCFHAHVLTLAFTVLAIGLAFNLLLEAEGLGLNVFGRGWQLPITLVTTAMVIGGLFTMNGWDYPTYMGLAIICIALQQWLTYQSRFSFTLLVDIALPVICLVVLSLLFYLPFYVTYISPAQGLGLVAVKERTPLGSEFLIYGLFIFIFVSLLIVSAWKRPLFRPLRDESSILLTILISIAVLLGLDLLFVIIVPSLWTFVAMGSIALVGIVLACYHIHDRAYAFALLLGALAFLLVAGCELFFLRDLFADQYPRMNTVFKFYFQAWALLSIACGCGFFFLFERFWTVRARSNSLRWLQRGGRIGWVVLLCVFLLASTAYPLLAPESRLRQFNPDTQTYSLTRSNSLDGLTYLQHCRPPIPSDPGPEAPFCTIDVRSDYAAIRWLNAHVVGDPAIIEAIGDDYSLYGRVSIFTGLPSLMNWAGHEEQWRVNWLRDSANMIKFNQRFTDVDLIYTSLDARQVLTTMAHYQAQYIYVGNLERVKYPNADLRRFSNFMQTVYDADGVTIYKVR